jgi:pre-mRNA-splicing factor CDC5/CEF1
MSRKLCILHSQITLLTSYLQNVQEELQAIAERGNKIEKKLALHLGGYQQRAKTLRSKIIEAASALEKASAELDSMRTLQIGEEAAIPQRLEKLRDEVAYVSRRERETQELYRERKEELDELQAAPTNGYH